MSVMAEKSADATAIRPFTIETPESDLDDLRARIVATRFPEKETVDDISQGPQLAMMQALARYWAEEYDWRKCEEKLNAVEHFITEIDGLDIHFIHVRSEHDDALPLVVTHGWPGSVIEQLKIIDPLTNPTAHGASASDAFHLVIPSMPGYGFSGKPAETGWGPERIARAYAELMKRLGYDRYVATGGDWGAEIVERMGARRRRGCSASTPTSLVPFDPTSQRRSRPATPPVSMTRKPASSTSCCSSSRRTRAMQSRARRTRRRCTELRIHPSASPPG